MTDDLLRYGTLGGAYVGNPERIARLFENEDIARLNDGPWEISRLGGKERWPTALDYISNNIDLFRQWAYRRADGDRALLQEIDRYVDDVYQWLKQGKMNGRLDDIELERLKRAKEALTEKLSEYVPERLIAGGLASIEQLLRDIENTEHVARYPAMASPKWYNAEIVRLCLLAEKIKLLMRLVEKTHPETADKYNYLHYLDEVVARIISYKGVLERSRDGLHEKVGTGKVNVQEHLSEIDEDIDKARKRIDDHFTELRERLASSKPLAREEILRALRQYESSRDVSVLPPIRQLYNALKRLKEPTSEDTSTLGHFIIALGRAIRNRAGYHCGLFDHFSIVEVLREMQSLNTGKSVEGCGMLAREADLGEPEDLTARAYEMHGLVRDNSVRERFRHQCALLRTGWYAWKPEDPGPSPEHWLGLPGDHLPDNLRGVMAHMFGDHGPVMTPDLELPRAYALLAILHDHALKNVYAPIADADVWPPDDQFSELVRMRWREMRDNWSAWHTVIDMALNDVRADLARSEPADETNVVTKKHKPKRRARKKTPPQLLRETRERHAVKALTQDPEITSRELGKKLGCDASTIVRLKAWKSRGLLHRDSPRAQYEDVPPESDADPCAQDLE
ncbi:hypothetical protein [Anaerobaca lacustris]|uniref:Uncharacterized protein n=1 Tax=Anaerobaca lacustris TaxID=3044600 RepID=A0AAW6U1R5_9BACT|nr:hypothetical protein [Sedimentisphaerales bacterium M17dextr]